MNTQPTNSSRRNLLQGIQDPLPFTIKSNWRGHLTLWAVLALGLFLGFLAYYDIVIRGEREWGVSLFIGIIGLVLTISGLWFSLTALIWTHFSAETITTRSLLKSTPYPADKLQHIGLRHEARTFKGRKTSTYTVELHFDDKKIIKVSEEIITYRGGDWSSLYELTARLQAQYSVTAPPNKGDFIL